MAHQGLSDEEVISLQVLALLMFDKLPMNCSDCEEDKTGTIMKKYNCNLEDEGEESVFYAGEFGLEFTTCPMNYVLPIHYEFIDKYNFLQEACYCGCCTSHRHYFLLSFR